MEKRNDVNVGQGEEEEEDEEWERVKEGGKRNVGQ